MEPLHCPLVDRMDLVSMVFPEEDVLTTADEKSDRCAALHRATQVGNLQRTKVELEFWDQGGCKRVATTVWACTSKVVVFKEGMTLPVHRVARVVFATPYHSSVV